jgi:hypothetical protein
VGFLGGLAAADGAHQDQQSNDSRDAHTRSYPTLWHYLIVESRDVDSRSHEERKQENGRTENYLLS